MNDELSPKKFGVTKKLFRAWRSPRLGEANPHKIESDVWQWLASSMLSGYSSTKTMKGPAPENAGPTWCFDRFGQTKTKLPDGRVVYIGGEHEDHYDPDFCIYNDVAVLNTDGSFEFYCYPESEFPPTDFHSATLIGDRIIIVGALSYPKKRDTNLTQIAALDLTSFTISLLDSTGDNPGWIHRHDALFNPNEESILITKGLIDQGEGKSLKENIDDWSLDIQTWNWSRLTDRKWPQLEIHRRDNIRNYLWEIRQALWSREVNRVIDHENDMRELKASLGRSPDLDLIKELYNFDFEHTPAEEHEEEHNIYSIYVDDVKVRLIEDDYCLKVVIEGDLNVNKIEHLKENLIATLSKLENTPYAAESN
ncbi:MAG: hypothetical protein ACI9SP_002545 [Arenicella sp.]|jgi:hypothetical protein